MADFTQQFDIIYKKFANNAVEAGQPNSKLAFARFLGVSQGKMQAWEKGQIPKAEDLKMLHDKMGLSYHWLITGEGEPFEEESISMKEYHHLKARVAELETKLHEAERVNGQLTARLFVEGVGDQGAATDTGKTGEGAG